MYFGHGFDSRLVHSQSGLITVVEPLEIFKGTQNEIIKHMNTQLTKGEICTSANLIKFLVRTQEGVLFLCLFRLC